MLSTTSGNDSAYHSGYLFNLLRIKIGEEEAKALTNFMTQEDTRRLEEQKAGLALKANIVEVKDEVHRLDSKTEAAIHDLRLIIEQRFGAMDTRNEQNTNKLLIWLVSVIFAASGLIVALIKLL